MKEDIKQRIATLQSAMVEDGISATIVPQTDPHLSEYIADHWQVRRHLSGFTGSAGSLVVTQTRALLWVDSRYWLQGAAQVEGTGIELMKEGMPEVPDITDWICANLTEGDTVGIDGMVFSVKQVDDMRHTLKRHGIALRTDFDPARVWNDRPALPKSPTFLHDEKYSGESAASKIARILDDVNRQGAEAVLLSDLMEVAWTLNIRSKDIATTPVVSSFLYVSPAGSRLFIDPDKLTPEVSAYLKEAGVQTASYESVTDPASYPSGVKILYSPTQTAHTVACTLGERAIPGASPVALLKGCKNAVQIEGVRRAMERDGVALVKSFIEIEKTVEAGGELTEMGVADILLKHRSAQPLFFDISFDTIAGYGPHGAIVHYSANKSTDIPVVKGNLLLVDSGASYLDGTTDITRTISLGTPTAQQRHDFTLVMKGHIALAQAIYPTGTRGAQLDVLARINLWKEGLSYLHGTGHGVGHFLSVHEGPQSIRLNDVPTPLMCGMITSNEPGLYRADQYGIRCENLVLTTQAFTTEFGDFLRFETLTLFPFDLTLFDTAIMSYDEVDWVNNYHDMVRERLTPYLDANEAAWLKAKTARLTK